MTRAAEQVRQAKTDGGCRPYRTVVIADRGDRAFVVAVDLATPPAVGACFEFQGLRWEITNLKTLQRGFLARPVHER